MKKKSARSQVKSPREKLLGDYPIELKKFGGLSAQFRQFQTTAFCALNQRQKAERVNRLLLELIQKERTPCFLLPAVIDFIEKVNVLAILDVYAFFHFELWLNQFSQLTAEENHVVRGKIVGKWIPREEYQVLFPIGMGKIYT